MASKPPIIRQVAWLSLIPQLVVMAIIFYFAFLLGVNDPILVGALTYLFISTLIRRLIPRNHRRGIKLFKKKKYDDALEEFKKSLAFFQNYWWIDKYRFLTLLSSSKMSYREMALLNIAFCYGQIGDGQRSKEYYEKTLSEFPNSSIADASLKMFEAASKISNK